MTGLPYSQSCENNKAPILAVLQRVFANRSRVLEIGSGTGQHATWFAEHMPHLRWRPSDVPGALPTLRSRCDRYTGNNLLEPLALDVSTLPWSLPELPDAVFTANSLHIMPWESVVDLFVALGEYVGVDTCLAVYGPFNYDGHYTSASNARFDQWLASQSPCSAIRDFEKVRQLADEAGFALREDNEMPANNRLLVFAA